MKNGNVMSICESALKPTRLSEKSLYAFLRDSAELNGEQSCIITENQVYSRTDTLKIVESITAQLYNSGLRKGDFVALRTTRSAGSMFLILALHTLGAVCVNVDPYAKAGEFVRNSGTGLKAKYYITNEEYSMDVSSDVNWLLKDENENILAPVVFDGTVKYDGNLIKTLTDNINVHEPSLILFTSGSTGKSKAVVHGQYSYINNSVDAEYIQDHHGHTDDISICVLSPHHILGFAVFVNAVVTAHAVFFPKEITPDYVLSCIEKRRITRIYSVPTYYLALIADDKYKRYNLSSLRFGLTAAGPITPEQFVSVEKCLGFNFVPVYGLSEYVALSCGAFDLPVKLRANGVGLFFPSNEGFILDDNSNPLPPGEVGEICVRGYASMLGYFNNDEETKNVIDNEGRVHTGDLGFVDENGILHISGRKKDIIIRAGENLVPSKIETALLSFPDISAAVVVSKADAYYGEVPVAMVVLKKNVDSTEQAIKLELERILPKNHIPSIIKIEKEIPLTSTGKIDKMKIKGMF